MILNRLLILQTHPAHPLNPLTYFLSILGNDRELRTQVQVDYKLGQKAAKIPGVILWHQQDPIDLVELYMSDSQVREKYLLQVPSLCLKLLSSFQDSESLKSFAT